MTYKNTVRKDLKSRHVRTLTHFVGGLEGSNSRSPSGDDNQKGKGNDKRKDDGKSTGGSFRCRPLMLHDLAGLLHIFDTVDEGLELAAAAGVTELAECLGFDLTDALAGDLEGLADFF